MTHQWLHAFLNDSKYKFHGMKAKRFVDRFPTPN